jgi:DNA-binding ferritin-like protein
MAKEISKTKRIENKKATKNGYTKRKVLPKNTKFSMVIHAFLGMLNTVKLYHWKTYSYAEHKATDKLYDKLNDHMDTFVEIMLGKDESRFSLLNEKIKLLNYASVKDFKARVYAYRTFLINMGEVFDPAEDSDLLNVRDEILGDINQFLYLMTFTK